MQMFYLVLVCGILISATKGDERGPRVRRIVGGVPADFPPEDEPVVFTRFNGKSARVAGSREFPHYVFKGIRFAHSPTGKERFLRPKEYFLEGDINATAFAPPCLQPVPGENRVVGNEDCLFLNIFTPELPLGTEGLPVVIWIHGGGFRYGSASQYGVRHLVAQRLLIVTIQYRLGSLGFLSSGTQELPGNAALWDMALAVQWVRNYIGFFGGNPNNIVVMGQGTGGSGALLVTLSNIAKGISGVVAMSGTSVSQWAIDHTPADTASDVAENNGCPTGQIVVMVRCLQNLPAESIIRSDSDVEFERMQRGGFVQGISGRVGSAPVREGRYDGRSLPPVVQNEPIDDLSSQRGPKIPLLTGITKDETKKAVEGQYKEDAIKSLITIPNFLDNVLVRDLQSSFNFKSVTENLTKQAENVVGTLDPLQFRNYLKVTKNNFKEGLGRISEVTGDALFNVPAFLTAHFWSQKGAPTFLYRFEHTGKASKGYSFLKGMPIVGNSSQEDLNDTVSHGDDLAYLFDVNDIYGNPLENSTKNLTNDDITVRNIYTKMIGDFAREKKINVGGSSISPFSTSSNNFIQIKPQPEISNNFRYCEMALWLGFAERLKSQSCQFLQVLDDQIKNVQQSFFDTFNATNDQLKEITGGISQGNGTLPNLNIFKDKNFNPNPLPNINPFGGNNKGQDNILGGLTGQKNERNPSAMNNQANKPGTNKLSGLFGGSRGQSNNKPQIFNLK